VAAHSFEQEEYLMRFGLFIRQRREASSLTQQQLAIKIGISRYSIANMEAGRQDTTVSRMNDLARVLRFDTGDLP
jgi:transcriptional regulator with XRE-family HTH domain